MAVAMNLRNLFLLALHTGDRKEMFLQLQDALLSEADCPLRVNEIGEALIVADWLEEKREDLTLATCLREMF